MIVLCHEIVVGASPAARLQIAGLDDGRPKALMVSRIWTALGPSRLGAYAFSAIASLVAAFFLLHLWHLDITVPLYYSHGGDELISLTWIKALLDDGWVFRISHLGAPFAMSFGDFPIPNVLHLVALKIIVTIVRDPGVAANLYFLLGFAFIAVSALYVLRRLGYSNVVAIAISIVYAFLPMRFFRNEAHLFYAQYFMVPFLAMALLWVLSGRHLFDGWRPNADGWLFIVGLAASAWDNQYDAFFGMMLLVCAGAMASVMRRSLRPLLPAIVGFMILFGALLLAVSPNLIYQRAHGKDPAAVVRLPAGAEVYALTFAQLVLPIEGHRFAEFANKRAFYDQQFPVLVNENSSVSLGLLGAIGFVVGLSGLMLLRGRASSTWSDAASMNLLAFVIATVGGVGALLSYYYLPEIRAYNRISPLIAFFSMVVIASMLEAIERRFAADGPRRRLFRFCVAAIVVLGLLDQTSVGFIPLYAADKALFVRDRDYAAQLEGRLGPHSSIYQLPDVPFPESPPVADLGSWDQTALYLHSKELSYSFGTTRGRPTDAWILETDALPPRAFLQRLVVSGFGSVAVYRLGFADRAAAELSALRAEAPGEPTLTNADNTIVALDLSAVRSRYLAALGSVAAERARSEILASSMSASLGTGFYGIESAGALSWSWAPSDAVISVANDASYQQAAVLTVTAASGLPGPSNLTVSVSGDRPRTVPISQSGTIVRIPLSLPPGVSQVHFHSNAPRLIASGDPRDIRFRLTSWSVRSALLDDALARAGEALRPGSASFPTAVSATFGPGCSDTEFGGSTSWNWCDSVGHVVLDNPNARAESVRLRAIVSTSHTSLVTIAGVGRSVNVVSTTTGAALDERVTVPPGTSVFTVRSSSIPFPSNGDPRRLVVRLGELSVTSAR